ncbi:hypothetical protein N9H39_11445, partial [Gammaproteobacteria bacterium]|nr:hypothetical protein [Gammaproteobacteria bacterium]
LTTRTVIPAQAGIQYTWPAQARLDPGPRRDDRRSSLTRLVEATFLDANYGIIPVRPPAWA